MAARDASVARERRSDADVRAARRPDRAVVAQVPTRRTREDGHGIAAGRCGLHNRRASRRRSRHRSLTASPTRWCVVRCPTVDARCAAVSSPSAPSRSGIAVSYGADGAARVDRVRVHRRERVQSAIEAVRTRRYGCRRRCCIARRSVAAYASRARAAVPRGRERRTADARAVTLPSRESAGGRMVDSSRQPARERQRVARASASAAPHATAR